MRTVLYSITANQQLRDLLTQGLQHYSADFVEQKGVYLVNVVDTLLARFPGLKPPHPKLKLRVYPVEKTPFVVLYDFDETTLRVHFIVHRHADLSAVDPTTVQW